MEKTRPYFRMALLVIAFALCFQLTLSAKVGGTNSTVSKTGTATKAILTSKSDSGHLGLFSATVPAISGGTLAFATAQTAVTTNTQPTDGVYFIQGVGSGKYLDVYGASTAAGAKIDQYRYSGTAGEEWIIRSLNNGYYSIIPALNCGFCLDVYGGFDKDGTSIDIWANAKTSNQQWKFVPNSDGSYTLMPKCSTTRVLDVPNGSTADSVYLEIWSSNGGSSNQKWILQSASQLADGIYSIKNVNSSKYLQVSGGSISTPTTQATWNNSINQLWYIHSMGNGYYNIIPCVNQSMTLDLYGGFDKEGETIQIYTARSSSEYSYTNCNQAWMIFSGCDGTYMIMPEPSFTRLMLVNGASTSDGAVVDLGSWSTSNDKKWFFTAYNDTLAPSVPQSLSITSITGGSASLAWGASSDNAWLSGYKVYRNGTLVGTTTTNSFTDTGLNSYTPYTYQVSAYDLAGNESAKSTVVNITNNAISPSAQNGATLLTSGTGDSTNTISSPADVDYFKISRDASNDFLEVSLTRPSSGTSSYAAYYVAIYDPAGNLITKQQMSAVYATDYIRCKTPQAGSYYIEVYGDSNNYNDSQPYTIKVQ